MDPDGREIFILEHGGPVRLLVDYRMNDPALAEKAQVVVALHRDGAIDICRFIARDLAFDGASRPTGTIEFRLAKMPVTEGRYSLTVLIAEEGYYDRPQTRYFSMNPGVYACASRMLEFDVTGDLGTFLGHRLRRRGRLGDAAGAAIPGRGRSHDRPEARFPRRACGANSPPNTTSRERPRRPPSPRPAGRDFRALERHSPSLVGFDWAGYLR